MWKSERIFLPFCHNPRVWQTYRRTEFSSQDRVCITCSAVTRKADMGTAWFVCVRVCVGRRVQYCHGFLDVHGRWNNGFYCRRRRRKEPSDRSVGRRALYGGCCGNDTYRFCCDVSGPSLRHHSITSTSSSSSSSSSAAAADNVHGYQSVRSSRHTTILTS